MESRAFVEKVTRLAPFSSEQHAVRAIECVLHSLARLMSPALVEEVAGELPRDIASWLRADRGDQLHSAAGFFAEIATAEQTGEGFAREHVAVVLRAVVDGLPPALAKKLRDALPAEVSALAEKHETWRTPTHLIPDTAHPNTIAAGRSGSQKPVSEASPRQAHQSSIAASDSPHAESNLATSRGLTQERLGEDLAEGHVGSDRPVTRHGYGGQPGRGAKDET